MCADRPPAKTLRQLIDQAGLPIPDEVEPRSAQDALGRYPITGQLGEGGMGQILQIRDEEVGREMAAKVIKSQDDPLAVAALLREAKITGQLEHPNIVPLHELGMTDEGRIYFTMKRIEGADLAQLLDPGVEQEGPTLFEYLQIFVKICDAISFAHSRDVIHRDLKPANIMVGRFGEVQVMDWGLARVVGQPDPAASACTLDLGAGSLTERTRGDGAAEPLQTLDGSVVGTPAYMPPEQARGEIARLDRRTDVYALGAILYVMLTLEPPFEGDGARDVVDQVIQGRLAPPSKRTPEREIPRELEAVVLKAMSPEPRQRYETVAQIKQEIEAYIEGRLLQAAQYNAWQVAQKWAVRHKTAIGAAAAVALLSAVLVTLAFLRVLAERDETRKALAELKMEQKISAEATRVASVEKSKAQAAVWVRRAMELYRRQGDRD